MELTRPVIAWGFRATGDYLLRRFEETIERVPPRHLLIAMRRTGVSPIDVARIGYSARTARDRRRAPVVPLHEAVGEVIGVGDGVTDFAPGQMVVPQPNIPCYAHAGDRYPDRERACPACRVGGAGENFCHEPEFRGIDVDGFCKTHALHLAERTTPLPEGFSLDVGALAGEAATCWAAIRRGGVTADERVVVFGAGPVGRMTAALLSMVVGVKRDRLVVADVRGDRLAGLEGMARTANLGAGQAPAELAGWATRALVCLHGRAAQAALAGAVGMLGAGGVAVLIDAGDEPVALPLRQIAGRGLELRGSRRSTMDDLAAVVGHLGAASVAGPLLHLMGERLYEAYDLPGAVAEWRAAEDLAQFGKPMVAWGKG